MTRTAPRAIIREKVRYEGRTRRSDRGRKNTYGPTRNEYGPTRNKCGKSMRVNGKNNTLLLPKFVLSTMSHESEHSESEFYYPDELSHAELLQSPTHSESKERNLTLLAIEEAHNFLRNQQANRR